MSALKATKGPWVIGLRHQNKIPIHHEDLSPGAISSPLALVTARVTWLDEACANSHLIAAAPCMAGALEEAKSALIKIRECSMAGASEGYSKPELWGEALYKSHGDVEAALRKIDTALARARGETSK
jgi:hypothetical protein